MCLSGGLAIGIVLAEANSHLCKGSGPVKLPIGVITLFIVVQVQNLRSFTHLFESILTIWFLAHDMGT